MVSKEEIFEALDKMILSVSGWRGVFALNGSEESTTDKIDESHRFISGAAALVFAEYLKNSQGKAKVLLGCDTRPTGKAIASAMVPVLLAADCEVCYAGFVAAPEIMAWARSCDKISGRTGFIYISASHNPIGHNGIKFGLTDGGVLAAEESLKLIKDFHFFWNLMIVLKK
uniref:Phosphohexose mutase family protein n=1 Tax=uncultured bacterium contig00160 TaxID=1181593 RepID=A0A806K229_9BACT|nr:phosphohexose mutase family protein [uncultured bacterium contig00160]